MAETHTATQIITAMITPALLIMGSGSLISTALLRLGRIVDRARQLIMITPATKQELSLSDDRLKLWTETYKKRATFVEHAVSSLFLGVSLFIADCLSIAIDLYNDNHLTWLPVSLTVAGMACMLYGSFMMVRECHLATRQVHEEIP